MKVHTLPPHLVVEEEQGNIQSFTVERNDSLTRLSEIEAKDGLLYIPRHIFEDALADTPVEEVAKSFHKTHVIYDEMHFAQIQKTRQYAYRACKWYPSLASNLPTAKSILYLPLDADDAKRFLEENIDRYSFVRTCHMSPKDIKKIPLFTNAEEAMDCLLKSERTGNLFSEPFCEEEEESSDDEDSEREEKEKEGNDSKRICGCAKHLFIRERKEYEWESRCFWSRGRLTGMYSKK